MSRRRVRTPAPASREGNLCACLVTFARWHNCCVCGALVLYVDALCRTAGDVECPTCEGIRAELAMRLRPSLPTRLALRFAGLFTTANDNDEARA